MRVFTQLLVLLQLTPLGAQVRTDQPHPSLSLLKCPAMCLQCCLCAAHAHLCLRVHFRSSASSSGLLEVLTCEVGFQSQSLTGQRVDSRPSHQPPPTHLLATPTCMCALTTASLVDLSERRTFYDQTHRATTRTCSLPSCMPRRTSW
jgi:hypothetical protein